MFYFTFAMLLLAISAQFRGPVSTRASVLWFFVSWLPGELPWFFAAVEIIGVCVFLWLSKTIGFYEVFLTLIASATFIMWVMLHLKTTVAGRVFKVALHEALGENFESTLVESGDITSQPITQNYAWLNPFGYKRQGIERLQNISYGCAERNLLDIYRQAELSHNRKLRPVLLHIHGGAWIVGNKHQQGQPLLNYLAQNDWVCVDINYRLVLQEKYPACVVDVKKAIIWIKENIKNYGGDPNFIAITGESAGGHLCALAGLTPNNPVFQPGFEACDTQVQAIVPVYGVYDFTNPQHGKHLMPQLLEKYVMPKTLLEDPDGWKFASPLFHVKDVAVPVFVIHGDKDCVVPVQQAQNFVRSLKRSSKAPVVYAELPGAQHGFDIFHSIRTEFHVEAVARFLHYCYAGYKSNT